MAFFCPVFRKPSVNDSTLSDEDDKDVKNNNSTFRRGSNQHDVVKPARSLGALNYEDVESTSSQSSSMHGIKRLTHLEEESRPVNVKAGSRIVIKHDFEATVNDELTVYKSQTARVIYIEGDWAFIRTEISKAEGFIPVCYCSTAQHSSSKQSEAGILSRLKHAGSQRFRQRSGTGNALPSHGKTKSAKALAQSKTRSKSQDALHLKLDEGLQEGFSPLPGVTSPPSKTDTPKQNADSQKQPSETQWLRGIENLNRFLQSLEEQRFPSYNEMAVDVPAHPNSKSDQSSSIRVFAKPCTVIPDTLDDEEDVANDVENDKIERELTKVEPTVPDISMGVNNAMAEDERLASMETPLESDFVLSDQGFLLALYDFKSVYPGDVTVKRGQKLVLLNNEDADWWYVRYCIDSDQCPEGFVPSNYLCSLNENDTSLSTAVQEMNELLVISDFSPVTPDDLAVMRNQWVYSWASINSKSQVTANTSNTTITNGTKLNADSKNKVEDDWLWVYSPDSKQYGFIPKSIVIAPPTSIL